MPESSRRHIWRASCTLCGLAISLSSTHAFAQWDPAHLAEVKTQAETAYEAGQYADAARAYIEFRSDLKSALETNAVPEELVDTVREALIATAYQLGRSNQLSGNCPGAVAVFSELSRDTSVSPLLALRAKARGAESQLCRADQAVTSREYLLAREAVGEARQELAVLEVMMAESTEAPTDEITSLQFEIAVAVDTMERKIGDELGLAIEDDLARERCPSALTLLDLADQQFADHGGGWGPSRQRYQDTCVRTAKPIRKPVPKSDPLADDAGMEWEPILLTSVGAATLLAAIITDAIVASQLDDYEHILATCRAGVASRCRDARTQYDDVKGLPDVVLGLYIAGGAVTAGGLIWWLVSASADDPAAPKFGPQVSLFPLAGGAMSSVRWSF